MKTDLEANNAGPNKTLNTSSAGIFGFAVQRTLNEDLKFLYSKEGIRNNNQVSKSYVF